MKNRFCKMGKSLLGAMCLLSTCGVTYSCSDDYDLDETMPGFLGGSIYDELKSGHSGNFSTVVRLIDDLKYTDVLSKTGSKTLFVADDEAYQEFFRNNSWGVTKYEDLSTAQKSILLYGAMLNNADVLEMLPYSNGGGSLTMRRSTALTALDSVKLWDWNELPENLNVESEDSKDHRFWDRYRNQAHGSMLMALDASSPMLLHFIEEQMKEKNITRSDVSFVLGEDDPWEDPKKEGEGSASDGDLSQQGKRTYIYNRRVVKQDVTCMNGYFNVLDGVLVTPSNMAEVIRENGDTKFFSAMLDRFSAPYYNDALTLRYRQSHDIGNDSVFEKRYLSSKSAGGAISRDPDGNGLGDFPFLVYDPGWNEYAVSSTIQKEYDMAAMFVPNDEAMFNYFTKEGGLIFMKRYGTEDLGDEPNMNDPQTVEKFLTNLYQIPLDIMQALINNLMKESFNETVPSKYYTITNDAQDVMFEKTKYKNEDEYKAIFTKCLLANNGIVYVMDRVMAPADFASVMGPSILASNTQIVKSIVRADDNFIGDNYSQAPLQKYYSTYLKAMQSRFSFFVPVDEGLGQYGYVDPMSLASKIPQHYKYWRWEYRPTKDAVVPVRAAAYRYNPERGQSSQDQPSPDYVIGGKLSEPNANLRNGTGKVKRILFLDMIDQHIIVHDSDNGGKEGVNSNRKYYTARSGAPVIVLDKGGNNGEGMKVNGGFQWELKRDQFDGNDYDCEVIEGYDQTSETNGGYGNGMTYFLNRPMQPATKSVFSVLSADREHYSAFFNLCNGVFLEDDLILAGFKEMVDNSTAKDKVQAWKNEQRKYVILTNDGYNPAAGEKVVRFLNNYRYTAYIPSNEAMQTAFDKGLMTHDQIHEWIEDHVDEETGKLSAEDKLKAQAMVTTLVNFMKYHFQDQAFYVDKVTKSQAEYQTSCTDYSDEGSLNYVNVKMRQEADKLYVTDRTGNEQQVVEPFNILARDVNYDAVVNLVHESNFPTINGSSYVVLHQVSEPLTFIEKSRWQSYGGRYDGAWADKEAAKAFMAKYRIVK